MLKNNFISLCRQLYSWGTLSLLTLICAEILFLIASPVPSKLHELCESTLLNNLILVLLCFVILVPTPFCFLALGFKAATTLPMMKRLIFFAAVGIGVFIFLDIYLEITLVGTFLMECLSQFLQMEIIFMFGILTIPFWCCASIYLWGLIRVLKFINKPKIESQTNSQSPQKHFSPLTKGIFIIAYSIASLAILSFLYVSAFGLMIVPEKLDHFLE